MSTDPLENRILQLENNQKAMVEHFTSLVMQFGELSKSINKDQIGQWAVEAVDSRRDEISKLTSDCAKVLNYLCNEGLVDRTSLNEALK